MPSGSELILNYLKAHLNEWVHNQTLRAIASVNDTPRTIRSLRQLGWQIEIDGKGNNRLLTLEKQAARSTRISISQKTRYEVLAAFNHRCRGCGRGIDDGIKLEIDHVVPVDWGGKSEFSNLQPLCTECNHGKQAWVADAPSGVIARVMQVKTVEGRIEALFDALPNQDLPSTLIQLISRNAFDWQRALRRIRQRTGKRIEPTTDRRGYHYFKED